MNHTMTTNLPLTVNELKRFCELQIAHWRWECYVYIIDDEEWNGYHPCWCQFTANKDDIENSDLYPQPIELWLDTDQVVLLG